MLDGASTSAASADTPPVDGNYGSMVRDQSAAANRKFFEEAQKAADLYLDNVKKNTGSEE